MIFEGFNSMQHVLLLVAMVLFAVSLWLHVKDKDTWSLALLLVAALCINLFAAMLDPFLNVWDERFHALVARNMIDHPLLPTLYDDPVVPMDYDRWDRYHIWLHKQPLFMWQMALSFRVFGISELSMRLPNVLLGVAMVFAVYRSAKLVANSRTAFVAAWLVISSFYLVQMLAGRQQLDQNDYSFLAYVSLSLWAFIEYVNNKNKLLFAVLAGVFAGAAVLCKWLPGLLVFLIWGVYNLAEYRLQWRAYWHMLAALAVACLVFVPWQLLCYVWYPAEFAAASSLNAMHFTHAVDGQAGSFWYHFYRFQPIYGSLAAFAIVPGFVFLLRRQTNGRLIWAMLAAVLFVYVFYALAKTKMPSFTLLLALPVYVALAEFIGQASGFVSQKIRRAVPVSLFFGLLMTAIVLIRFDAQGLHRIHNTGNPDNYVAAMALANKAVFESLDCNSNAVLFNIPGRHYIEAMFYTGLPAYGFIPDYEQYLHLKNLRRNIVVFSTNPAELPEYLLADTAVIVMQQQLYRFD